MTTQAVRTVVSAESDPTPDARRRPNLTLAPAPTAGAEVRAPVWSIRWIVTAAMVGLVAVTVLSVGAFSERSARRALELELHAQLQLQARNLAMVGTGAMLSDVPEWTLLPLIKELLARHPDYAFVVVVDPAGAIVADSETRRLGTRFVPPSGLAPLRDPPAGDGGAPLLANRELLVTSTPILHSDGRTLGTVWLGLERAAITQRLEAARREQLIVFGVFLVFGVAAALALSSVMLRPIGALRAGLERIGRGDLDTRLEVRDRTELGALAGTINRMATELKTAQTELIERERIAHEVQLARRIQRSLLPEGRRVIGAFVIEGEQRAASEVGGDYYQLLDLPEGRVGIVMADVSGKGLGGSLVTAMLHALLRPLAASHRSPASLLEALDRQLGGMLERGSFVTMFYAVLDPATHTLTFASAGHNPLLVARRDGTVEWLRAKGAPLAALRGRMRAAYEDVAVAIGPGDLLFQYTDGISEALRADGSQFGLERMAAVAARTASSGARALLDALSREVAAWRGDQPQHDDETVLAIARELDDGAGTPRAALSDSMARFAEAQTRGVRLTLPSSRAALVRIDDWLAACPGLSTLEGKQAQIVRLALHEACLNVVQHAYGDDGTRSFDLWWVRSEDAPASPVLARGFFLLRDRGQAFRYQEWKPPSLEDPATRRKGHGFGIAIMQRAMDRIVYEAGTPEGNLTCLVLGPGGGIFEEEEE